MTITDALVNFWQQSRAKKRIASHESREIKKDANWKFSSKNGRLRDTVVVMAECSAAQAVKYWTTEVSPEIIRN